HLRLLALRRQLALLLALLQRLELAASHSLALRILAPYVLDHLLDTRDARQAEPIRLPPAREAPLGQAPFAFLDRVGYRVASCHHSLALLIWTWPPAMNAPNSAQWRSSSTAARFPPSTVPSTFT